MKQFSEGIPTEMLEAARIDGASEAKTFIDIVLPMVKPGIGALAIFTFINSWNDYFMQLIMLSSTSNLTISLGIAKLQAENSTDFGLIMQVPHWLLCLSSSSSSFSRSTLPKASLWVLLRAKIPTAACGQRLPPAGGRCRAATKRGMQGGIFGAAVCKTQGPPKGRSGCRAPQEALMPLPGTESVRA